MFGLECSPNESTSRTNTSIYYDFDILKITQKNLKYVGVLIFAAGRVDKIMIVRTPILPWFSQTAYTVGCFN